MKNMQENEDILSFKDSKLKIFEHFEKIKNIKCGACGSRNLTLLDGFFNEELNTHITNNIYLGGFPRVPSVGLVCTSCGNIMKFSAGVIGLLPNQIFDDSETKTDDKKGQ